MTMRSNSGGAVVIWMKIVIVICALVAASDCHRRHDQHQHQHPLVVASILVEPYLMMNAEYRNASDPHNHQYVGYIAELLQRVSQLVGFTYVIRPVQDGGYGYLRQDGTWDGIVGEIVNGKASIAAAPIYVTRQRAKVVDFTDVFMTVYATVLMKKATSSTTHDNHLTAAIRSAKDLVNQSEVRYGTLNKGVLVRAFKKTNVSTYKLMWRQMQTFQPSVFTQTNEEGIERIRRQNYAFILPHTIAEYVTLRKPCDLTTVGRFLMHRGYALAVRKDSPLRRQLNDALRTLFDAGYLDGLSRKWWLGRSECGTPAAAAAAAPADSASAAAAAVIPRSQKIFRNRAVAEFPPNDVTGGSSSLTSHSRRAIFSLEFFVFLCFRPN